MTCLCTVLMTDVYGFILRGITISFGGVSVLVWWMLPKNQFLFAFFGSNFQSFEVMSRTLSVLSSVLYNILNPSIWWDAMLTRSILILSARSSTSGIGCKLRSDDAILVRLPENRRVFLLRRPTIGVLRLEAETALLVEVGKGILFQGLRVVLAFSNVLISRGSGRMSTSHLLCHRWNLDNRLSKII